MLPATADRVNLNTADEVNEYIRQTTAANLQRAAAGGLHAIDRRLVELDYEWDVERALETMAPSMTLAGLFLGATVSKKWFVLPLAIQSLFLLHALQGWCPPLPVLRRMGFRTLDEINQERYALKGLRGDFKPAGAATRKLDAEEALEAVER